MDSKGCTNSNSLIHGNNAFFRASPTNVKGQVKEVKTVKMEQRQETIYEKWGRRYDINPDLLQAIAKVESGENPNMIGDGGDSIGLMQIQPKYHAHRLKDGEDLLDPGVNIRVACEYLTELMERYDTLDEVLTAYNAGHDTGSREYANRVYEEME